MEIEQRRKIVIDADKLITDVEEYRTYTRSFFLRLSGWCVVLGVVSSFVSAGSTLVGSLILAAITIGISNQINRPLDPRGEYIQSLRYLAEHGTDADFNRRYDEIIRIFDGKTRGAPDGWRERHNNWPFIDVLK